MSEQLEQLLRERDRLRKRLARERNARAQAEEIAERAITDLAKSNRDYATFFDLGVHLFCTLDPSLRFRELNPAWESVFGWTIDELRGRPLQDFAAPEDVEQMERTVAAMKADAQPLINHEQRFLTRDGQWRWLSWSARLAGGVFYAEARDITRARQAALDLATSEARVRSIFDSAVDAILIIDAEGIIRDHNAACERMFGYASDELADSNVAMLMPEPYSREHDGYIRNYLGSGVAKVIGIGRETVACRKDGRLFPIELAVGEVRLDDRRLFTGIVRDITEREATLRRQEELLRDLQQSRDDLLTTLNQLRIGTLLVDASGLVSFASTEWDALEWADRESAIGRPWADVLPLDAGDRAALRAMARRDRPARSRLSLRWRNIRGEPRAVDVDVRDDPRDHSARILFVYDRTEERELRARLEVTSHGRMVGGSKPMRALYEQIERVAQGDWTVLVEGETGSGKELVARAIHAASARQRGPFIAVNCAGLTDTLLESQLFGHRKGAFTGALHDQQGLFEAAAGGTILLDEIGDISVKLQSTLLRVLQEREVMRLGETKVRPLNVRILAATNRDLVHEVERGRFRQDLLYRIRVARVVIPPLRERLDDVPLLVAVCLAEQRISSGKPSLYVQDDALEALRAHSWPGNVRELRSAIEFAVIRCAGSGIGAQDLPPEILASHSAAGHKRSRSPSTPRLSFPGIGEAADGDRDAILAALAWAEGNRARAARRLGISRATLYRRLVEHGIEPKRRSPRR